ncbi:MAG: polysaccharide deacetylase family protein [Betaproteobacteria bacterium]|nr:polysaccharide deacetylase family protein [Betaproteobacteria bacterium]
MPLLGLKIDVDTWRGTREGVPRLVEALHRHGARATFLFSLGPDHTGRAIKRVFRRGFLKKVSRTSVLEHYGLRTLLNGTLLPGPDIGRPSGLCADIMRRVRDAGFEVGIHCWDHVRWQDGVAAADAEWTQREVNLAVNRFESIFGERPRTHGAAGWQMNRHALRLTQQLGFEYCSDGRGTHPFLPVTNAELIRCPQLPTTLPTLDELIGVDGVTLDNVAAAVTRAPQRTAATAGVRSGWRTRRGRRAGRAHIFTLHAELEGMKLLPRFEQLLSGWREQGYRLTTTREIFESRDSDRLPRHEVVYGEVPGRSGTLMLQGIEFLKNL